MFHREIERNADTVGYFESYHRVGEPQFVFGECFRFEKVGGHVRIYAIGGNIALAVEKAPRLAAVDDLEAYLWHNFRLVGYRETLCRFVGVGNGDGRGVSHAVEAHFEARQHILVRVAAACNLVTAVLHTVYVVEFQVDVERHLFGNFQIFGIDFEIKFCAVYHGTIHALVELVVVAVVVVVEVVLQPIVELVSASRQC